MAKKSSARAFRDLCNSPHSNPRNGGGFRRKPMPWYRIRVKDTYYYQELSDGSFCVKDSSTGYRVFVDSREEFPEAQAKLRFWWQEKMCGRPRPSG